MRFLIFILFLVHYGFVFSQSRKEIDLLNKQFFELYDKDLSKANRYAQNALKKSRIIHYKEGEGAALYRVGIVYDIEMKADSARLYLLKGIQVLKQTEAYEELGDAYNNLGAHYYYQFEYKKAIEVHELAINYFNKAGNVSGANRALNNIGICYKNLGDLNKALATYERTYKLGLKQNDSSTIALSLASISGLFEQKKEWKKALEYNYNSEKWIPKEENYTRITVLFTRGEILRKQHLLIESEKAYAEGLALSMATGNIERAQYFLRSMALLNKELGKVDVAFRLYEQYDSLRDEMYRKDKNEFIEASEQKFKVADKELQRLKAVESKQKAEQELEKNQRKLVVAGAVILFFAALSFLAYRANSLKKKRIQLAQERLEESEMLSKELHHRIKNNLQMVASLISIESRKADAEVKNRLQGIIETLQVMSNIHEKLYGTAQWDSVRISTLFETIREQGIGLLPHAEISIDSIDGTIDLDSAISLGIILNEWMTNSIKHAFGNTEHPKIQFGLKKNVNTLMLLYSDNGTSNENSEIIQAENGFGTKIISILLRKLNGELSILKENGYQIKIVFDRYTYEAIENSTN